MSITQTLQKFFAARVGIPGDALDRFFTSAHLGRGAETLLPFPAELIPLGARLVMRGWANNKFFPSNRDWVLPYWAERQFDPRDPGFIPRGFNLYTINYTHRDWTMVGNLAREREAIVDPRGLVTPWFDGWSLDVWLAVNGQLCAPSRLPDEAIEQSLHENLPMVVTTFRAGDLRVRREAFAVETGDDEWLIENVTVENSSRHPQPAELLLALRPFNPEGVSPIHDVRYVDAPRTTHHAFLINDALAAIVPQPDSVACSNFEQGDVALSFDQLNGATHAHCAAGLAHAVATYRFELGAGESKTFTARMPLRPNLHLDDDNEETTTRIAHHASRASETLRDETIALWRAQLERGMRVRLPDERLQNAFDANKAFLLLLHDGQTITPGPFTYHQFWMRDAAYLLNALDKLGYHDESRQVIERFARRIQKDGYFKATEGEWDSNGAAIWTMLEHARLSGDTNLLSGNYWHILRMASWINSKRQKPKATSQKLKPAPHLGLLPSGPSAEHLGPADYFYWDDFWGLAGLRDAAFIADWLQAPNDAKKLRANYESFRADVDTSLARVAEKLGRAAMPASPYRRLDAGMVGSLVALTPLHLFDARDPRIVDTLDALKEFAWLEDAYFNHVGHSAFGTYLSLHIAQCLLLQRDARAWQTINWVVRHASPTFTWAEGIHPLTRRGGMGDGHHGWALADFLLTIRNALLFEENNHLVLTPALPVEWTAEMNVIKVENAPTHFGDVSFTIAFGEHTATLVVTPAWRQAPEYIEWNLPFTLREIGSEEPGVEMVGNTVRLPRGVRRVVAMW